MIIRSRSQRGGAGSLPVSGPGWAEVVAGLMSLWAPLVNVRSECGMDKSNSMSTLASQNRAMAQATRASDPATLPWVSPTTLLRMSDFGTQEI